MWVKVYFLLLYSDYWFKKLHFFTKFATVVKNNTSIFTDSRDIAQLGRAPALGAGGRRFKSYYPDSSI